MGFRVFGHNRRFGIMLGLLSGNLPSFYVATTGNDTTGNGSSAAPWKTITKAIATVPDIACNVFVAAGTYAENTSGLNYLFITRNFTYPVTLRASGSVTITDNGSVTYCVRISTGANLRFDGFTIEPSGTNNQGTIAVFAGAALDLANCVVKTVNQCVFCNVTGAATIRLAGCSLVARVGAPATIRGCFLRAGNGGNITAVLSNCVMTMVSAVASSAGIDAALTHAAGLLSLTISGGSYSNTGGYCVFADGASVSISNATIQSVSAPALVLGEDTAGTYTTTGSVENCTISCVSSHACLIGGMCNGVAVTGNHITGGDHGLVFKECDNCFAVGNTLIGGTLSAAYFKAAVGCSIISNVIDGAAAAIVLLALNADTGNKSQNCTLTDNFITPHGAADCLLWNDATQDAGGGVCDRNVYDISDTTGDIGTVRATANIGDLLTLQGAWSGYDVSGNDANSTVIP